jgi:hypothetical protein
LLSEQTKVATPFVTVTGPVPSAQDSVLEPGFAESARLTVVELSDTTTLLRVSSTDTTNMVDAPAATFWFAVGCVVNTTFEAAAALASNDALVAVVRPLEVARSV